MNKLSARKYTEKTDLNFLRFVFMQRLIMKSSYVTNEYYWQPSRGDRRSVRERSNTEQGRLEIISFVEAELANKTNAGYNRAV